MITPEDKDKYVALSRELYSIAFKGRRIYNTNLVVTQDDILRHPAAELFKVRQRINYDSLYQLKSIEFKNNNSVGIDLYMNRICDLIAKKTRTEKIPFSTRFGRWPASDFEEWIEETHNEYFATGEWFSDYDKYGTYDYALLLTIKAPVPMAIDKYKNEYESSITLTKLGVFE